MIFLERFRGKISWKNVANLHSDAWFFVLTWTKFRVMLLQNLSVSEMKLGKNDARCVLIWKKCAQNEIKCSRFLGHFWTFFRANLRKFGQKSFARTKICLLLHLWAVMYTVRVWVELSDLTKMTSLSNHYKALWKKRYT